MNGIKKFLKSFYYAHQGIKSGSEQRNFKIHVAIFLLVIVLATILDISSLEWILIIFASSLVLTAELLNSAIEEVCNILTAKLKLKYLETWNPRNLAAGAVLISAIGAALVGLIIFVPKIANLLR